MALLSLGNIDKNLIPILIGCVVCFLNRLLNQYDGTLLYKNLILANICISLSRLLAFIPYLILKKRSKNIENKSDDTNIIRKDKIKYLYYNQTEKIAKGKWQLILLSAIVYLMNQYLFIATFEIKTNTWIWIILITSIFYYLMFKIKIYRHHYVSAILILLIGIIIDIVLENIKNDINKDLLLFLLKFIRQILFSLYNVMAKYIMEKKFISVYEFSTYIGVIAFVLLVIFFIFDYTIFDIFNYKEYFNNFDYIELLVILGVISTQFGINLCSLFTVRNNSPCHIFVMFVFGQIAYYINFEGYSIFVIICLILILFLSLIFNEIIELNFWGLSDNTKKNIINRAEIEDNSLIIRNDTIDSIENEENIKELKENIIN